MIESPTLESINAREAAWDAWLSKNAKPKFCCHLRPNLVPTRFSRPGPMSEKDWKKFLAWARTRAKPKNYYFQRPDRYVIHEESKYNFTKLMPNLRKLATPKYRRNKHLAEPQEDFNYSPEIYIGNNLFAVKRDPGRPFPPPIEVPYFFQSPDVELNFWADYRFPIRASALVYKPTTRLLRLTLPKLRPPPPIEEIQPRSKMTRYQWKRHLKRLRYLAAPRTFVTNTNVKV